MKNQVLLVVLFSLILSSCQNVSVENKSNQLIEQPLFHLSHHSNKFKFQNLKYFEMDTISWEHRAKYYHKLNEDEFHSVYQDTSKNYYGGYAESIEIDCFYSIQNRDSNFQEITVLWQREGEYCDGITYLIFNTDGKLIDKFQVAGSCGDAGYFEDSYGKFINDSTYKLTIEDNYKTENIEINNIITRTETLFTISSKGLVKKTEKILSLDTLKL